MQVERSETQHGATWNSLPLARSTRFPLCTDSAPRERQWGGFFRRLRCACLRL
ncbi:MAG: hypothetical protein LBU42_09845 [Prevotellaceae bacterium]|nr:hypothetical protein [Prevotellaceae bacterium]